MTKRLNSVLHSRHYMKHRYQFCLHLESVSYDITIQREMTEKEMEAEFNPDDISSEFRDIFKERYHVLSKRLLSACGLWSSQSFKKKLSRTLPILFLCVTILIAQLRAMLRAWTQFNVFVESFTPMIANVLGCLKLVTSILQIQEIKAICDEMQRDWDDMRHLPQVKILKKYGDKGRQWTIFYFTLIFVIVSGWVVMAFSPKILDAIAPLNYSRRRFDLFPTDFGVDPDEYFYPIMSYLMTGLVCSMLITVTVDTLYMVLAQHVCAMFEILRYNLNNIFQDNGSNHVKFKPPIDKDEHYHKIVSCIKKHKVIIEYIESIENACSWRLIIIIGLSMIGLSCTGYLVVATNDDVSKLDTLRFACFGIAQVFHIFCNTLPSHWIMESSASFPTSVYCCKWYTMSLRSRQLILFLIRASIEPRKITAGKIYVVSMENFSSVIKTSMSYLAMLDSMQ